MEAFFEKYLNFEEVTKDFALENLYEYLDKDIKKFKNGKIKNEELGACIINCDLVCKYMNLVIQTKYISLPNRKDIGPELIEAKRNQLIFYRLIKEGKRLLKEE